MRWLTVLLVLPLTGCLNLTYQAAIEAKSQISETDALTIIRESSLIGHVDAEITMPRDQAELVYACGEKLGLWTTDRGYPAHILPKADGRIRFPGACPPGTPPSYCPTLVSFSLSREIVEILNLRDGPSAGQFQRSRIATFTWRYVWPKNMPKDIPVCFPGIDKSADKSPIQKSAATLLFDADPKSKSSWKWQVVSVEPVVAAERSK